MALMTFLRFFAVHVAVFAVANTTTEAEPEVMSTSPEPEPEPASGLCVAKTAADVALEYRIEAGCPNANPTSCVCTPSGVARYDCPSSDITAWQSSGKKCSKMTSDMNSNWDRHPGGWDYPADYFDYCPPPNGSLPGSPSGFSHWIEPGSYACTQVDGVPHEFNLSSAGFNSYYNTTSWCTQPGCWVSPCTCNMLDMAPSTWIKRPNDNGNIYYSYGACGGKASFTEALCDGAQDYASCGALAGCKWMGTTPEPSTSTTTTTSPSLCVAKTAADVALEYRIEAGCPNANPTSCVCTASGVARYDCPSSDITAWQSSGKKCSKMTSDMNANWDRHPGGWDYPADYFDYCPPPNGSLPGSPSGFSHWIEPGSYACTKVDGVPHEFNLSSAGFNSYYNTTSWCTQPGCWVSPCTCNMLDMAPSTWIKRPNDNGSIYYSYGACGGKASFTEALCDGAQDYASCGALAGCKWMGTTPSPSTSPSAPTTTPQTYIQTVVQTVTLTNLNDYTDLASLQAAYTSQMAAASGSSSSNVVSTVTAVVVKVTMSLTGVDSTHIAKVKQAIADLAGVDVSAVTLVQSRRLLEQSQKLEDERRLATTNWAASITVDSSNSVDMVSKAKTIHATLNNDTAVASSVGDQTGTAVTASTSTSLELSVSTTIVSNSNLNTPALDASIGSFFNASVQTTSHTGAPTSTSDGTNLENSDDAPWGSGYVLVGLMSVVFGVRTNLGL